MKNLVAVFSVLITIGILFVGIACTDNQNDNVTSEQMAKHHQAEEGGIPLIYHMSFISRYAKKLYFAGEAENWELADIYSHEIEEISEGIIESEEVHDGIDISALMKSMLLPQIEHLEEAIDAGDREMFLDRYNVLIQSCNNCHQSSDYGAVKVTVPEINPLNQDFEPEQ